MICSNAGLYHLLSRLEEVGQMDVDAVASSVFDDVEKPCEPSPSGDSVLQFASVHFVCLLTHKGAWQFGVRVHPAKMIIMET